MSKILDATCDATGKVKVGTVEVPDAIVMSAGKQQSSGILIIDGDRAKYLTLSVTDLESTLEKTSQALAKSVEAIQAIATLFTAIGAGMTGPTTAPPGTLAVDVANINSKAADITAVKNDIDQLKGALK